MDSTIDTVPEDERIEIWSVGWDRAIDWLATYRCYSKERIGIASKSELRRWFNAGNVWVNGKPVAWNDPINLPLESVVLFPKGKRTTLW